MKIDPIGLTKITYKRTWILMLLALLIFLFFNGYLNFNGLYGQDSHAYYQYSMELSDWLSGNTDDLGFFFWPKLFPLLGALLSFSGISELLALQLVSFFAFIGTLFYLQKTIQLLFQNDGFLFLLLGAVTQIYFVRGEFLVMSDMLTTFLCMSSFYFYFCYLRHAKWKFLVYFFIFMALAFFSRYASVVLLTVPAIHLIYKSVSKLKSLYRPFFVLLLFGIGFGFASFNGKFLASFWYVLDTWSPLHFFSRTFETPDGIVSNIVPNGLYVLGNFLHPGYLLLGVFLIPFYGRLKISNQVLTWSILVYLIFLAGHPMQNYRFLMIVHPLVLMLLFPAFSSLQEWLKTKRLLFVFAFGIISINLVFGWYSFRKTWKVHQVELEIVQEIKSTGHKNTIYSFYVDQSFKSHGIENKVNNFFYQEYLSFKRGALVVFNEEKFRTQWKGHAVMSNWERLKTNYPLDTVSLLSDNWIIYRIK